MCRWRNREPKEDAPKIVNSPNSLTKDIPFLPILANIIQSVDLTKTGDLQACSNGKSEGDSAVRAPCCFWVEGLSRVGEPEHLIR